MADKINQFAVPSLVPLEKIPVYDHGFSVDQVETIKKAKGEISKRDLVKEPVTLLEFKTIIVPFCRIHRVEQFILHPVKVVKSRKPRAIGKKVTVRRPKKLTKAAINKRLSDILFLQATNKDDVTQADLDFLTEHTKDIEKL